METNEDTSQRPDDSLDRQKIVPEWGVAADEQIVLVAFIALAMVLGLVGWNQFRGSSGANGIELTAATAFESELRASPAELRASRAETDTRVENRVVPVVGAAPTTAAPTTAAPTTAAEAIAAPAEPAIAVVTATDDAITLVGTVPSEDVAAELRAAAAAGFAPEQIDDQLVVVEGADPFDLTVSGTLSSQDQLDSLTFAFGGVATEQTTNDLELDAGASVAAALNELFELEPVLFESGTNVIVADSFPTIERATAVLLANPDAVIEIGGHTDSRGSDESNLSLSQSRADAVLAALQERGVTNQMTAVGFGETELLESPDDTPAKQQANRRIEFTAQ
ncbi:MAG: outer membrane protein OmpA-like peptidoglycan-associated protein [Acidimicrobiales bacterium]